MSNLKYVGVAAFALAMSLSASAGAWGEGPFDNDDAQDWLIECSSSAGPGTIAEAINAALRPGYLEADAGSVAVAAAEVIAAADGKGPATTNAEAAPCLAKTRTPEVRALVPSARHKPSPGFQTPSIPNSLNNGPQASQTGGLPESASLRRGSNGNGSSRPEPVTNIPGRIRTSRVAALRKCRFSGHAEFCSA
ncbi:DUF4259 domain-containing protein [Variovorax sp. N23]|uniref:DUF4259 domain-containing protein n=1 Tax=Variovorax sp. N23 TaxID=2980555 RepID=UPI0021C5977F|nr:DUF4259 domain-containing protein [Variovorax sp. N23]MCU4122376.1 DUF4259 domain-containing protein [Variovorax sp. N23]